MKILINLQSFDDNVYRILREFSAQSNIDKIYLASSLMNDIEPNAYQKFSKINKVYMLKTNNLFSISNMSHVKFDLEKKFIEKEEYLYMDFTSSYRWLPISKREENDFFSFSMIFYYEIYNFWNDFFKQNKIDYLIQLNEEHSSLDSILVRVAKKYSIQNIITSRPVGAYTANSEEYHALYDNVNEKYLAIEKDREESSTLNEDSNFAVFSEAYKNSLKDKMVFIYKKFLLLISSKELSVKEKTYQVWSKFSNKIVTQIKLYYQYRYVKKLKKYYATLAVDTIDLNSNYIYYCLHFDPEAATLPKDNANANQLLNIRILASSLPKGWKLYVKEHPHQVDYKIYFGYLLNQLHSVDNFRSKNFYEYISSLENVELVGLNNNHQDLIQNSKFVVSNTGTVFREASYMKKHCLTFSKNSFYAMLDNIHVVEDINSCKDIIEQYKDMASSHIDVDELFNNYSVTIKDISRISSIMLIHIFEKVKIKNDR